MLRFRITIKFADIQQRPPFVRERSRRTELPPTSYMFDEEDYESGYLGEACKSDQERHQQWNKNQGSYFNPLQVIQVRFFRPQIQAKKKHSCPW